MRDDPQPHALFLTSFHHPSSFTHSDMPLLTSPATARSAFDALPVERTTGLPSKADLAAFAASHFAPPGSDYLAFTPPDLAPSPRPPFLPAVADDAVRAAAVRVHALWPALCRRPATSGGEGGEPSSSPTTLLPTPGWSVVPGDRFRESYSWDAHWTVRGLVACGCMATATAVFSTLVALAAGSPAREVPNGARSYYRNRSQPPLLSPTGAALFASGDPGARAAVLSALSTLRAERAAWDAPHRVVRVEGGGGETHSVARYCARWGRPRPEAYREDVAAAVAAGLLTPADAQSGTFIDAGDAHPAADLWRGLATAAESGWDFSTRWAAGGLPRGLGCEASAAATPSPRCCAAHRVVPVDLNAFLIRTDDALALLCRAAGLEREADAHEAAAEARRAAVDTLMWSVPTARWCDLVRPADAAGTLSLASGTFAASWVPLWAGCGRGGGARPPLWPAAVASLAASGLVGPGGAATSLACRSGEQWDGPNAWPPLQALLADGLAGVSGEEGGGEAAAAAGALAEKITAGFVSNALAGLAVEGTLREKYCSSRADGTPGEGGEYATQVGFGWTNGVVLALLRRFGWPARAGTARAAGENGD